MSYSIGTNPKRRKARVLEADDERVMVSIPGVYDSTVHAGELVVSLWPGAAEELMHALEGWKDER